METKHIWVGLLIFFIGAILGGLLGAIAASLAFSSKYGRLLGDYKLSVICSYDVFHNSF